MSMLTVKVCEECGRQSVRDENWLVIRAADIRSARTDEPLMLVESDVDLCSPGCLVRYFSRHLEPARNGHLQDAKAEQNRGDRARIKVV